MVLPLRELLCKRGEIPECQRKTIVYTTADKTSNTCGHQRKTKCSYLWRNPSVFFTERTVWILLLWHNHHALQQSPARWLQATCHSPIRMQLQPGRGFSLVSPPVNLFGFCFPRSQQRRQYITLCSLYLGVNSLQAYEIQVSDLQYCSTIEQDRGLTQSLFNDRWNNKSCLQTSTLWQYYNETSCIESNSNSQCSKYPCLFHK